MHLKSTVDLILETEDVMLTQNSVLGISEDGHCHGNYASLQWQEYHVKARIPRVTAGLSNVLAHNGFGPWAKAAIFAAGEP